MRHRWFGIRVQRLRVLEPHAPHISLTLRMHARHDHRPAARTRTLGHQHAGRPCASNHRGRYRGVVNERFPAAPSATQRLPPPGLANRHAQLGSVTRTSRIGSDHRPTDLQPRARKRTGLATLLEPHAIDARARARHGLDGHERSAPTTVPRHPRSRFPFPPHHTGLGCRGAGAQPLDSTAAEPPHRYVVRKTRNLDHHGTARPLPTENCK